MSETLTKINELQTKWREADTSMLQKKHEFLQQLESTYESLRDYTQAQGDLIMHLIQRLQATNLSSPQTSVPASTVASKPDNVA